MSDIEMRAYVESLVDALRREVELQRVADRRALETAERTLLSRLEHMNEFREQILEDRRQYIRVDTFRWTVGFLVSFIVASVALVRLLR